MRGAAIPGLLLVLCSMLFASEPAPIEAVGSSTTDDCHEEGKDLLCSHAETALARLLAEEKSIQTANDAPTTDLLHCFLDLDLDFSNRILTGSNTLTVASLVNGLSTVSFDLRDNMLVTAISLGSQSLDFTQGNNKVSIALDRPYAAGESFVIKVVYYGRPENLGWGSFAFTSSLAASLSEAWYAHTWWPCKEDLSDKFTTDMWITVPSGKMAVSNGSLQGTDTRSGSRLRYRWHESYPIATYLVSLAVYDYDYLQTSYTHPGGSMPIELYSYSLSATAAQDVLTHMLGAVATFSRADVFGEYPFVNEKYGIAEFSGAVNMEHQTISSHHSFDLAIVNHELAHQWWGDMITCGTWHDIWLNEGFATYAEAVYEEKKPGGSFAGYQSRMSYRRPSDYSGTVYVYDSSQQSVVFNNNLVYRKAAWVLHMLRHVVGDETFFEILTAYRAAYGGSFAVTQDFEQVAEAVYGQDLSWFFNEWVYGPGSPDYRYGWQYVEEGGRRELRLYIRQVQTNYPLFRMPIDVTVTTPTGSTRHVVWHEYADQWYTLAVDGPVSAVTLDQDSWILHPAIWGEPYVAEPQFRMMWTSPLPGAVGQGATRVSEIQLYFEQPPTFTADDFSVAGSISGPRVGNPVLAGPRILRLLFVPPLQADQTWTVRISDRIHTLVTGKALDGEISQAGGTHIFPSGNGVPGGDSVFSFAAAFPGDYDGDRDVDLEDFGFLQLCLLGTGVTPTDQACLAADLDHDQDVDGTDEAIFQNCMGGSGVVPRIDCGS